MLTTIPPTLLAVFMDNLFTRTAVFREGGKIACVS
jgi:hypothetical protein